MSTKTEAAIAKIREFIRGKQPSLPFELFYPSPFEKRLHECVKRNRSFENDFIKFLEHFEPSEPKRGLNVHSTGASKTDFAGKGHGSRGGYRLIYYYDIEEKHVMLFDIFAKNEK